MDKNTRIGIEKRYMGQEVINTPDDLNLRPGRREWLGQVDFWENVKEFILKRIPTGSRSIDKLY